MRIDGVASDRWPRCARALVVPDTLLFRRSPAQLQGIAKHVGVYCHVRVVAVKHVDDGAGLFAHALKSLQFLVHRVLVQLSQELHGGLPPLLVQRLQDVLDPFCLLWC
eukprot:Skav233454  [mRNA]  locus=scaffold1486:443918:446378:+ [translate_table: standard]